MTTWLMPQDEIDRLEALFVKYTALDIVEKIDASSDDEDDPLDIVNGVALIKVEGVLTPKKIRWLSWFGEKQTVYSDIERKVREADAKKASRIVFAINSPGGDLEGLYEAMNTISDARAETESTSGYLLASAAYMLASQTGSIEAKTEMSLVGSVGVATTRVNWGGTVKEIANTDSPKKRPDVGTKKGVMAVQEELDDIYQILAEKISSGRNTTIDTVKKEYGQGAVMTARTAKQRGMIDSIGVETHKPTAPKQAAANQGDRMNAQILKEEHPEVYDAILQKGVKAERDRVSAHLVAAEGGDIGAAHEAIQNGEGYTELVKAKHDAFARKQQMIDARKEDNAEDIDTSAKAPNPNDEDAKIQAEFAAAHPGCTMEVI